MSDLKTMSVIDFCKAKGFASVAPSVRVNKNDYPYITFITKDNKAENVYFSKKAAMAVAAGTSVNKELLTTHQIGETTNEAGEPRLKLISNSERVSLDELFA
jgi:uncharacterized protein YjdB